MALPFEDRFSAGRALGTALEAYADRDDVIVLALPRGGVPVAYEVAKHINAPLDLMLVRKLGVPDQQELAMGAIAVGGVRVLNQDIIRRLSINPDTIDRVAAREQQELDRRLRAYRGNRPLPVLQNKCVILVDDGLATGATMRAAIAAARQQNLAHIVVAVPVAPIDAVEAIRSETGEVICLETPEPFAAIGRWYVSFDQTNDNAVRDLLAQAWDSDSSDNLDHGA